MTKNTKKWYKKIWRLHAISQTLSVSHANYADRVISA